MSQITELRTQYLDQADYGGAEAFLPKLIKYQPQASQWAPQLVALEKALTLNNVKATETALLSLPEPAAITGTAIVPEDINSLKAQALLLTNPKDPAKALKTIEGIDAASLLQKGGGFHFLTALGVISVEARCRELLGDVTAALADYDRLLRAASGGATKGPDQVSELHSLVRRKPASLRFVTAGLLAQPRLMDRATPSSLAQCNAAYRSTLTSVRDLPAKTSGQLASDPAVQSARRDLAHLLLTRVSPTFAGGPLSACPIPASSAAPAALRSATSEALLLLQLTTRPSTQACTGVSIEAVDNEVLASVRLHDWQHAVRAAEHGVASFNGADEAAAALWTQMAMCLLVAGQSARALAALQEALLVLPSTAKRGDPSHEVTAMLLAAKTSLNQLQKPGQAVAFARHAVQVAQRAGTAAAATTTSAAAAASASASAADRAATENAAALLDPALTVLGVAQAAQAVCAQNDARRRQGQRAALSALHKALQLGGGHGHRTLFSLALQYGLMRELPLSLKFSRAAVSERPQHSPSWALLALLLSADGQLDRALDAANAGLATRSGDVALHLIKVKLLLAVGGPSSTLADDGRRRSSSSSISCSPLAELQRAFRAYGALCQVNPSVGSAAGFSGSSNLSTRHSVLDSYNWSTSESARDLADQSQSQSQSAPSNTVTSPTPSTPSSSGPGAATPRQKSLVEETWTSLFVRPATKSTSTATTATTSSASASTAASNVVDGNVDGGVAGVDSARFPAVLSALWLAAADLYVGLAEFDKAMDCVQAAAAADPLNADVLCAQGRVQLDHSHMLLKKASAATSASASSGGYGVVVDAAAGPAVAAAAAGGKDGDRACRLASLAFCTFERALALCPDHAPSLFFKGKMHLDRGEPVLAESCLQQAVRLDPLVPDWWHALGLALSRRGAQKRAADALFQACELEENLPVLPLSFLRFCL